MRLTLGFNVYNLKQAAEQENGGEGLPGGTPTSYIPTQAIVPKPGKCFFVKYTQILCQMIRLTIK